MNKKEMQYLLLAIIITTCATTSFIDCCEQEINEQRDREPKNLVICTGVQKGGTSSFWHYFYAHPNVVKSKEKEIDFFNKNFNKGVEWYKDQLNYSEDSEGLFYAESSPEYMNPDAIDTNNTPKLIHSLYPNVKLVIFLRNPVNRAWSHYKMILHKKETTESFENCINTDTDYVISRGLYSTFLKLWFQYFPKNQILIIKSEDFFADPNKVMNQIFEFVGLPEQHLDRYIQHHNSANRRSLPLNPETRDYLVNYFKPYNQELENLLGRSFNWD